MKFLVDECLSPGIAKALAETGLDVIHVSDRGLLGAPDTSVLSCAQDEQRVLISADTDFGEMLVRSGATSPSVILLRRQEHRTDQQAAILIANIPEVTADLSAGAIVVITQDHIRVRPLATEQ